MLITADLSSEQAIIDGFEGAQAGSPLVPGKLEFIPEGVRVWGSYTGNPEGTVPNEKYVGWWLNLEPLLFPYFTSPRRASMRYRLRVGEGVAAANSYLSGKWPGLEGTYALWAETVHPPTPQPSAFATWEARMFYLYDQAMNEFELGIYYYGVRNPDNGTPTSPGHYYGMGTQGGVPMTTARIKPGRWYTIEQQVVLNSVKNKSLFIDTMYPNTTEAEQLCLDNANRDGILRVLVDGVLVYEATEVAFRGLECVGVQSGNVNIYDGGHGLYPKSAAFYEFGSLSISDQVQGEIMPPELPEITLPTQAQKDAALAVAHATVNLLGSLITVRPTGGGGGGGGIGGGGGGGGIGGGGSVIETMLAGMARGQWLEMTDNNRPANMDAGLGDAFAGSLGNPATVIAYTGKCGYDSLNDQFWGVSCGHRGGKLDPEGYGALFWKYDAATNAFINPIPVFNGFIGSHLYQSAVSDAAGNRYLMLMGESAILVLDGSGNEIAPRIPTPFSTSSNYVAATLLHWPGKGLLWYDDNNAVAFLWNGSEWSECATGCTPYRGVYQSVSAYSPVHECVMLGGGGTSTLGELPYVSPNPLNPGYGLNQYLVRLDANGTKTHIADAPYHVGIFSGMQLTGDGAGEWLLLGSENARSNPCECWKLLHDGTLTRLADPPSTMQAPHFNETCVVQMDRYGAIMFIDFEHGRSPLNRAYLRKA